MKQFVRFSVLIFLLSSCIKNNEDPAWIEVNSWTLQHNPNALFPEGEMTHNFTDAWVYVNGKVIGVFEVPFKIPVLVHGNATIRLYPTVRNNGISATKKIYPFVEYYEVNKDLQKNEVFTINPTTRYQSSVNFWVEDFEDVTTKIENDVNSNVNFTLGHDATILKWGNFYGQVNLTASDSTWIAYTNDNMYLPKGKEVYLEIDYYNTNALITGLIGISSTSIKNNQNIQLNAQNPASVKWKKIYIDLKELVSNLSTAEYYKQSFQAIIDSGDSEGFIMLDNIKVVHF
jgi:hypothetical protein